jgi:hypothetical protein
MQHGSALRTLSGEEHAEDELDRWLRRGAAPTQMELPTYRRRVQILVQPSSQGERLVDSNPVRPRRRGTVDEQPHPEEEPIAAAATNGRSTGVSAVDTEPQNIAYWRQHLAKMQVDDHRQQHRGRRIAQLQQHGVTARFTTLSTVTRASGAALSAHPVDWTAAPLALLTPRRRMLPAPQSALSLGSLLPAGAYSQPLDSGNGVESARDSRYHRLGY